MNSKVLSILLFRVENGECEISPPQVQVISSIIDVSDFGIFKRGYAREILTFSSREIAVRTPIDGVLHISMKHDSIDFVAHSKNDSSYNRTVVIITKGSYCENVYRLFQNTLKLENPSENGLTNILREKVDDKCVKIQKDIDEVRGAALQNIDSLLERGEKIEDIIAKTQDLSEASKIFLINTKKLNQCCTIV